MVDLPGDSCPRWGIVLIVSLCGQLFDLHGSLRFLIQFNWDKAVRYRNLDMSIFHFLLWTWAVAAIAWTVGEPNLSQAEQVSQEGEPPGGRGDPFGLLGCDRRWCQGPEFCSPFNAAVPQAPAPYDLTYSSAFPKPPYLSYKSHPNNLSISESYQISLFPCKPNTKQMLHVVSQVTCHLV